MHLQDHQSFDLEDWLPITASRNANWYYSAFHNVTAMVGAGVLGLPYAMSELGWYNPLLLTSEISTHQDAYIYSYYKLDLLLYLKYQGTWGCGADPLMGDHVVHPLAND